jgi:hypothetical protein
MVDGACGHGDRSKAPSLPPSLVDLSIGPAKRTGHGPDGVTTPRAACALARTYEYGLQLQPASAASLLTIASIHRGFPNPFRKPKVHA